MEKVRPALCTEIRFNPLGRPYTMCPVCGHPEVPLTNDGFIDGKHLKSKRHVEAKK